MNLDPELLEILACPSCRASLAVDSERSELVCTGCGLAYPVRSGIPVLLVDEARSPEPDPGPEARRPDPDAGPEAPPSGA